MILLFSVRWEAGLQRKINMEESESIEQRIGIFH